MLTLRFKKHINWLKTNWADLFFSFVILVVTLFLAFKNYTPNTYLTGWDNLHPEFNFKLNIERSLNAVWQEYQGLGLLGGMGHAADLPRQLFLWGLSFVIPTSLLRYFWTFLMLFIGPLGVYFLVKRLTKVSLAGFSASIFYLFNLAIVQYFFVPFETFVNFYGFLPWLIYFAHRYLSEGKNLKWYAIVSILATCAFYVQTLFLVYLIILACLSFINLRRSIWLFFVTFLVNAFWLLPVIYFTVVNGSVPTNSKINSIATPETQYMNLARTDPKSIVTFKGYWFDYYDWNSETSKFDYLYKNWEEHSGLKSVQDTGIVLFIVSIIGLVISRQFVWILAMGVGCLMLSGIKIPISLLSEAFRNSFTKWSVALAFVTSIGIGYFVSKFRKILLFLMSAILISLSVYQVLPVFSGNLISESMRVAIPPEYFQSFDFLNTRTNGGRVVVLPSYNFWGWQFHSWGYRGSGFYWYGVKNPILDRAFDVWSKKNENFYEELNFALLTNDSETLKNVFKKYQATYILYDKNVFNPGYEIKTNFDFSEFRLIASFGNISIYETGYFGEPITTPKTLFPDEVLKASQKVGINEDFKVKPQIVEQFKEDQGYKEIKNCDLFEKGSVIRERNENGNIYSATNGGTACDYFYYSDLDNSKPFVLRIKGENFEGRSLKVYLTNVKISRVVLEKLMPEGVFDEYFLVNPAYFDTNDKSLSDGYTLSVETRSFGKVSSKNKIEKIEIYPVDLPEPILQGFTLQDNNLEILNVKKWGTGIYRVVTTGSGVLQLGQGYERGWIALAISHSPLAVSQLEHMKVNSWSNGFVVKANDQSPMTVVIFFWPQFLEWGGFILLFITFVRLLAGNRNK